MIYAPGTRTRVASSPLSPPFYGRLHVSKGVVFVLPFAPAVSDVGCWRISCQQLNLASGMMSS